VLYLFFGAHMGGGNAQKTAISRARHLAKSDAQKNAGGGKAGKEARTGGNMNEAMAKAQAEREAVRKKREEKNK
jgi:hypothetical protein